MTLDAVEFLRRFCLHILPHGFRKIRHYGILSSRNKGKLREQQAIMKVVYVKSEALLHYAKISSQTYDAKLCPCCKKGHMVVVSSFKARAPPQILPVYNTIVNSF